MSAIVAVAFGAGLLAPVNPCGFAVLPAYLGTFLQPGRASSTPSPGRRLRTALGTGAAITAGFTLTVTAVGVALAAGLRSLIHVIPWVSAVVGLILTIAGVAMLFGRSIPLRLPGVRPSAVRGSSPWRMVGFGAGYAMASASCTVAVLLAVVTQAVTAGTVTGVVAVFAANAAGSAIVLLALAAAAALANTALSRALSRLARHLDRISGVLLTASGVYLLAYWLPALLGGTSPVQDSALNRTSASATTWISSHQTPVVAVGVTVVAACVVAALVGARRSHHRDACCTDTAERPEDAAPVQAAR